MSSSPSTSVRPRIIAPALAERRWACSGSASHTPSRRATPTARSRSASTSGARKFVCTNVPSPRPSWSLRLGMMAVCGIGNPSGCRNSAVTANQSASAPTIAASAVART